MNPSTSGWISKQLHICEHNESSYILNTRELYNVLYDSGFIYGVSLHLSIPEKEYTLNYSQEELAKINLLDALLTVYYSHKSSFNQFLEKVNVFYTLLEKDNTLFTGTNYRKKTLDKTLEKIIQERVQTSDNAVTRNFSHVITNALLFIDVLSFDYYLQTGKPPLPYATEFEELLMQIIWLSLQQKEDKGNYDKLLLQLFEKSLRYNSRLHITQVQLEDIKLGNRSVLEKLYLLDLACLAVWDDKIIDGREASFIQHLGLKLDLKEIKIKEAKQKVAHFIFLNKEQITFLNYHSPVKHFYKQTHRSIRLLVLRNKNRLIKEISNSRELLFLLGQSTLRELNSDERKRVKNQLLDICKSVPSLAIFLLPGGSVLLPILIKFIPELLPSAFNENKIEFRQEKNSSSSVE